MRKNVGLLLLAIVLGVGGLVAYAISKFTAGFVVVVFTAAGLFGCIAVLVFLARRVRRPVRIAGVVAITLLAVVLGTYLVLVPLIYFFQDTIAYQTSTFFQPRGISEAEAQALTAADVEAIDLATADGARLRGWLVHNSQAARAPLVIFFDGSGSVTSDMLPYVRQLDGWSVALVNYRGFAPSTGTPSQANAFADATQLYDTLARRPDIDPDRIVPMGYSLGSSVATYLAAERPVAATVLVSPFDAITLIGFKPDGLYAPLGGIMHRYFDSMARAPNIKTPLLTLVGAADPVVAPARSQALVDRWGGAAVVKTYEGEDHSLLLHANSSWNEIAAFLRQILQD